MIVNSDNFLTVIRSLSQKCEFGIDTETYGLRFEQRLFAIQIYDGEEGYYFNFYAEADYLGKVTPHVLSRELLPHFQTLFDDPTKVWYAHNAKFDLMKLRLEGLTIYGGVHCTYSIERLIHNDLPFLKGWGRPYSLESCARRRFKEIAKDDGVKNCIKENNLWSWEKIPGKKRRDKLLFYYKVPFDILYNYGIVDSELAYKIGKNQIEKIQTLGGVKNVLEIETKLTPVLVNMDFTGIKVDQDYTSKALEYIQQNIEHCKKEIETLAGLPMGTPHFMKAVFDKFGYEYKVNDETENPIFDKFALKEYNNEFTKKIEEYRGYEKTSQYYATFLHLMDYKGIIHPNANQGGTKTGRFSYDSPNLQNLSKSNDDETYPVRGCFIPREGFFFSMIDYSQIEYRMMVDYSGDMELIEMINNGTDFHQRTADLLDIARKRAKTINFALLYGVGNEELAKMLGITQAQASTLRNHYFQKLPRINNLLEKIKEVVGVRGFVVTWSGRRLQIANDKVYKAPNALIQGGAADVMKKAMVEIGDYLKDKKSRMLVTVHDEILTEVAFGEEYVQHEIQRIMENVYIARHGIKLTVSPEYSLKSWAERDKIKGIYEGK